MALQDDPTFGAPTIATIESSLFDENHDAGLFVLGSTLDLSRSVVRRTQPAGATGNGIGLSLNGVFQEFVDQHGMLGRGLDRQAGKVFQLGAVIDDFHGPSAQNI